MIELTYYCDLCGDHVDGRPGSGIKGGKRIKHLSYPPERLELRELTDREASERIVCNECLAGLRHALIENNKKS